jgi:hypothetical protein
MVRVIAALYDSDGRGPKGNRLSDQNLAARVGVLGVQGDDAV